MSITVNVLAGPEPAESRSVILPDQGGVIGRSSGSAVVLDDPKRSVSKRHAFVERIGDSLYLTDLSTNGTFPFGKADQIGRGNTIKIEDGARFLCADFTLEFRLSDEVPANAGSDAARSESRSDADPGDPSAVVAGLLEGLDVDRENMDMSDPHAFGRRAGELVRHGLATVALAMRMRAHVKGSMHAEVTQLMPSQPNPMKISLNEVDALEAMLGPAHVQFQDPAAALHDVQEELRDHELAVLKAVRGTLQALLAELDPHRLLEKAAENSKGPWSGKHKKAWELLTEAHGSLQDHDRLDTLFGQTYSEQISKG